MSVEERGVKVEELTRMWKEGRMEGQLRTHSLLFRGDLRTSVQR
jgi:hypothetical protein